MNDRIVVRNAKRQPYVLIERAVVFDTQYLNIYDKMVYLALCGFADNQTQQSYPSRSKLADICCCSLSSVKRALKHLEELKLIHVERRKSEDGKNETNIYTLLEIPSFIPDPWGGSSQNLGGVHTEPKVGSERTEGRFSESHKLHSINYTQLTKDNNNSFEIQKNINNNFDANNKVNDSINFYQQNFGPINPFLMENIIYWENDLGAELVIEAMKRALKQQKKWFYAEGILKGWANQNIRSMEQVRAADVEFEKRKDQKKSKSYNSKPIRKEKLPDWYENNLSDNQSINQLDGESVEEKRKRLEEIQKRYKKNKSIS